VLRFKNHCLLHFIQCPKLQVSGLLSIDYKCYLYLSTDLDQPVISPSGSLTKKEGDSLSLTCTTDSKPSPANITWTLGTSTISSSSNMDNTNLSRSDQGQYTCTGRVNTGSVCPGNRLERTASGTVTVQCTYLIVLL
jgi:hypothetical protein